MMMSVGRWLRRCGALAAVVLVSATGAAGAARADGQVSAQDRVYLQKAHQSNLAEIAGGKLAQSKGQSARVKELGAMMVADHTKLDAGLTKVAATVKVTLPKAPNAEQRALQAKLMKASPAEFDALYVAGQLAGHSKAMRNGKMELSSGSEPAVKADAKKA